MCKINKKKKSFWQVIQYLVFDLPCLAPKTIEDHIERVHTNTAGTSGAYEAMMHMEKTTRDAVEAD